MLPPEKSLYSLKEATEILSEQYQTLIDLQKLVSYSVDGKAMFSVLIPDHSVREMVKSTWEAKHSQLRGSRNFDCLDTAINAILPLTSKYPSGDTVVYLNPQNIHYEFFFSGSEWLEISTITIDPYGEPYDLKTKNRNGKYFVCLLLDDKTLRSFEDYEAEYPPELPLTSLLELKITNEELLKLMPFQDRLDNDQNKPPNKQEQRELVLRGWLAGKGIKSGSKVEGYTRAEVWDELKGYAPKVFNAQSRKGNSIAATPESFFKNQELCKFSD